MINLIKKILFALYNALLKIKWLPVRKLNYKFGEHVIYKLGRAKYNYRDIKLFLNPLNMIDKQLINGHSYDGEIENIINETNWEKSCFLDIGANWGFYSLIAAKNGAEVFAFEPVNRELGLLYKHILENDLLARINVFPLGLSNKLAEENIFLGPERNTGTNSMLDQYDGKREIRIFNRMDNVIPASVITRTKLVKIDVEGFEYYVLEGMRKVMPDFTDTRFIIEITPGFLLKADTKPADIYNFFSEYGYQSKYGIRDAVQYDEVFYKDK